MMNGGICANLLCEKLLVHCHALDGYQKREILGCRVRSGKGQEITLLSCAKDVSSFSLHTTRQCSSSAIRCGGSRVKERGRSRVKERGRAGWRREGRREEINFIFK